MNELLQPIWDSEIETMDVVFDICKKLNLRCYMAFGTLIGAVRHKGFIPWDDDVDLVMPRPDYDKFIKEAPNYLPDKMVLNQYEINESKYAPSVLKVENTECRVLRSYGNKKIWANMWVDIWPTDGVPDGIISFETFKIITLIRLCLCRLCDIEIKGVDLEEKSTIEKLILKINNILRLGKRMSRKKTYQRFENYLRKHPYDSCKRTVMIMGEERFESTMKREWYGDAVYLDFEGKKYPAPAEYDKVLRQTFGDYMKLPPVEKQVCRHVVDVKIKA